MSDHLSLETVGVDEDGFEVRDGFEVFDLAEDVGEFMLQQGRRVGEACQRRRRPKFKLNISHTTRRADEMHQD